METIDELKVLFEDFVELKYLPFTEFSDRAYDILHRIKLEISHNYISKSEDSFKKYSSLLSNELNKLGSRTKKVSIEEIKDEFTKNEYNYKFEEYTIESILRLDPESKLHNNLSIAINRLSNNESSSQVYFLQHKFLKFSQNEIITEIVNFLNSFNDLKESQTSPISKHKFHGSQTEFIELIKALIVNENLKGVQKHIIQDLAIFFDIKIKNPHKLIQDIKRRNNGSETLFLDNLKSGLINFFRK